MKNNEVNNILQKWAEENGAGDVHLERLQGRIVDRVRHIDLDAESSVSVFVPFMFKAGYASFGAVVALVTVVLCNAFLVRPSVDVERQDFALALASIPDDQLMTCNKLFKEMDRMFPDRLRWISDSDGRVGLGVDSIQGGVNSDVETLMVRISVVSRTGNKEPWRKVWNGDVLVRGEEMVDVAFGDNASSRLAMWVYPLADGKLVVDASINIEAPVCVSSEVNAVVQNGVPMQLMSIRDGEVEYRVFQTISGLTGKCGA